MTRRTLTVPTLLAACLALAACGGGATPAPAAPGARQAADLPTAAPTTAGEAPAAATPVAETAPSAETAAPAAAVGPVDACDLLTADEVATLVADAAAEASTSEGGPITSYTCTWNAAISNGMIPISVAVTASPGFVSGSGATPDFVRTMIEAEGSDAENGGRVVDGLGDAASVTSIVSFDATVQFLQGDTLVQVVLTAEDAPSKQDAVVDLARAVAGRLP